MKLANPRPTRPLSGVSLPFSSSFKASCNSWPLTSKACCSTLEMSNVPLVPFAVFVPNLSARPVLDLFSTHLPTAFNPFKDSLKPLHQCQVSPPCQGTQQPRLSRVSFNKEPRMLDTKRRRRSGAKPGKEISCEITGLAWASQAMRKVSSA